MYRVENIRFGGSEPLLGKSLCMKEGFQACFEDLSGRDSSKAGGKEFRRQSKEGTEACSPCF